MDIDRPIVIRGGDATAMPTPTAGMERRQLLSDEDRWVGIVRTEPGIAGGWHHHADHDSYIYVVRGSLRIEFGPGAGDRIDAGAGDLIVNPARTVHREITPPGPTSVELLVVRIGGGPDTVNVAGPEERD
jgi:uncharacterized RmlC-like cupin family protein